MNRCIGGKHFNLVISFAIVMLVWWVLTLVYPPLVVPTVGGVAGKLAEIATGGDFRHAVWLTTVRLLSGLAVAVGTALGAALGFSMRLHAIFRPIVGLMQSVPPVSWLVLTLIWFGFSGKACVFIVIVATLPVMTVNVIEGIRNIDARLLQMTGVYRFPFRKRLAHVILPSILPYFRAGLHVAMGIAAKTVVMGEVLTTSSGVGGEITNARLNIEPEGVVVWTIVLVALYFLLDRIAVRLLRGRNYGTDNADNSQSGQAFW